MLTHLVKKKLRALQALLIIAVIACVGSVLSGCSTNQAEDDASSMESAALYWMDYDIPSTWTKDKSSQDNYTNVYESSNGCKAMFAMQPGVNFPEDYKSYLDDLISQLNSQDSMSLDNEQATKLGNSPKYLYDLTGTGDNGVKIKGKACFILNGHAIYYAILASPDNLYNDYSSLFDKIIESINFEETSEPLGVIWDFNSINEFHSNADNSTTTETQNTTTTYKSGTYKVGSDMPAGEYKLTATSNTGKGYWCVRDSSASDSNIIRNENFENSTYVTVSEGEYIELSRCTATPVE